MTLGPATNPIRYTFGGVSTTRVPLPTPVHPMCARMAGFAQPFDIDPAKAEPELPEGIVEVSPGKYEAECRGCERWGEILCDLSEIPVTGYRHYCGGGPRCCP